MSAISTPFRFLSLPMEIRHAIYLNLFARPLPIVPFEVYQFTGQRPRPPHFKDRQPGHPHLDFPLNLLLACHQVHEEVTAVMYGSNIFRITDADIGPWEAGYLGLFMKAIGIANRSHLRHIELALDASPQGPTMFRDPGERSKIALAYLLLCFRLRTLTLTFCYFGTTYQFSFVFDPFLALEKKDKKRALQQLHLEMSATIKAFDRCQFQDVESHLSQGFDYFYT
ncbi:MAG: hypothetical protein Q9184_006870 [Pyrenodesmia sp. 2 TL-2023]